MKHQSVADAVTQIVQARYTDENHFTALVLNLFEDAVEKAYQAGLDDKALSVLVNWEKDRAAQASEPCHFCEGMGCKHCEGTGSYATYLRAAQSEPWTVDKNPPSGMRGRIFIPERTPIVHWQDGSINLQAIADAHNAALEQAVAEVRTQWAESESKRDLMSKMKIADIERLERIVLTLSASGGQLWQEIRNAKDTREGDIHAHLFPSDKSDTECQSLWLRKIPHHAAVLKGPDTGAAARDAAMAAQASEPFRCAVCKRNTQEAGTLLRASRKGDTKPVIWICRDHFNYEDWKAVESNEERLERRAETHKK